MSSHLFIAERWLSGCSKSRCGTRTRRQCPHGPKGWCNVNVQLHRTSRVFISLLHKSQRFWLSSIANARNNLGHLYLRGDWGDAAQARSYTFEIATTIRRRLSEQNVPTQISLVAGDLVEFIEEENQNVNS